MSLLAEGHSLPLVVYYSLASIQVILSHEEEEEKEQQQSHFLHIEYYTWLFSHLFFRRRSIASSGRDTRGGNPLSLSPHFQVEKKRKAAACQKRNRQRGQGPLYTIKCVVTCGEWKKNLSREGHHREREAGSVPQQQPLFSFLY